MQIRILTGLVFFVTGVLTYAAGNSNNNRIPEWAKPVKATDIVIAKKITSRGKPANPQKPRTTSVSIATGTLGSTPASSVYTILIGISDYPGTINDLSYCDDDALLMEDALACYGIAADSVLIDSQATYANIMAAINAANGCDEVIFYYSGHGANGIAADGDDERKDESIVVWGDKEFDDNGNLIYKYIWDGQLKQAFNSIRASDGVSVPRMVCIFDSCFSGGMKADLQYEDRIIAMASTETGYSYETDVLGHGEFTYYFADGIISGDANIHHYGSQILNEPSKVTVEEAYDYSVLNCRLDKLCVGDFFINDLLP